MADYLPVYTPAQAFTLTASAAITGGQLVEVTGSGTVGPAAVTSAKVLGVAAFDAGSGQRVTIWGPGIHEVTAAANITAGDPIKAAANGQVTAYTVGTDAVNALLGKAITTAASGSLVRFQIV